MNDWIFFMFTNNIELGIIAYIMIEKFMKHA